MASELHDERRHTSAFRVSARALTIWIICLPAAATILMSASVAAQDKAISEQQLQLLRERQDILVDGAYHAMSQLQTSLAVVGAIFTILVAIWTFRQIHDDRRRNSTEDQHLQQTQTLVRSYTDNITNINSLVSALRGTMEFHDRLAKKMDERMEDLDQQMGQLAADKKQRDTLFISQGGRLNERASILFKRCNLDKRDRAAFKSIDNREDLHTLSQQLDTFEQLGEIGNMVSPVVYFLRGLDRFNSMLYDEAVVDFVHSRELARAQIDEPLPQYGIWSTEERRQNLGIILDEIPYHTGIVFYNTGSYKEAREEFTDAYVRNKLDFRSRYYVPEVMFFDNGSDPGATFREFERAEAEMNNCATDDRRRLDPSWETLYAALKMRMGNFFVEKLIPNRSRVMWREYEDNDKAVSNYWEARENDPKNVFVNFSLALALCKSTRSQWRDLTPTSLFSEVFDEMKTMTFERTEPILLCLLYYCMAVCVRFGDLGNENWRTYLMDARQHLQQVPTRIRIFSPLAKIGLAHSELAEEMRLLEAGGGA